MSKPFKMPAYKRRWMWARVDREAAEDARVLGCTESIKVVDIDLTKPGTYSVGKDAEWNASLNAALDRVAKVAAK
jgi:hypothetical protein